MKYFSRITLNFSMLLDSEKFSREEMDRIWSSGDKSVIMYLNALTTCSVRSMYQTTNGVILVEFSLKLGKSRAGNDIIMRCPYISTAIRECHIKSTWISWYFFSLSIKILALRLTGVFIPGMLLLLVRMRHCVLKNYSFRKYVRADDGWGGRAERGVGSVCVCVCVCV